MLLSQNAPYHEWSEHGQLIVEWNHDADFTRKNREWHDRLRHLQPNPWHMV